MAESTMKNRSSTVHKNHTLPLLNGNKRNGA